MCIVLADENLDDTKIRMNKACAPIRGLSMYDIKDEVKRYCEQYMI